jgi:UDP-glucose 4-epimerase
MSCEVGELKPGTEPSGARAVSRVTLLLTGGAGFIGSHLHDRLSSQGQAVTVVDDLSTGRSENLHASADLRIADIVDQATVELVASLRPEAVIHCAAQASVVSSFADPTRDALVNIVGSVQLIEAARTAGVARFIYVTTGGALYGNASTLPVPETHQIQPLSPYGVSKWTVESYLNVLGRSMTVVILRLANVYGPRQVPDGEAGVVSVFIDRMRRGVPVEIHGDGEQTRDFLYVTDVAEAVEAALAAAHSMIVNIGTGHGTSIRSLYDLAATVTGFHQDPVFAPARVGDVRRSVLAVERAKAQLGWQARTSLIDGLRSTADWLSNRE